MKKRTITALIGLPIVFVIIFVLPKICSAFLFALICGIGAYEFTWRTGFVKFIRLVIYTVLASIAVVFWSFYHLEYAPGILILLVFSCVLFLELMLSHGRLHLDKIAVCLLAGFVIPFLLCGTLRILTFAYGRQLVAFPFILAFFTDIGAYLVGSAFGRHKLAPSISPKKTVEGVVGSLAVGVALMLIYCLVLQLAFDFQVNYLLAILYGVIGTIASVFGDLMFSAVKRQAGIKDYGNLLPGHGGVLDRFDSMVTVAPLTECLILLIPVVTK